MNKKVLYIILLIIFGILFMVSLLFIIHSLHDGLNTKIIVKNEEKYIKEENDNYYLDKQLFKDNKYTIGWIIIDGTEINYPVVKYKDNDYYLNHDFYNNYNDAGWIFMDSNNSLNDQNLVIYGHHRSDNTMFGSIDKLFNKDYYHKYGNEIRLITNNGLLIYKIFSVYSTNTEDDYNSNNFLDFESKINELKNKSIISFDDDISNISQIITLSTCHNNNTDRLVVHGFKKR